MNNPMLKVAGLLCLIAAPAVAGGVYSPGDDFSLAGNPNGVWSYGYEVALGGPINLYSAFGNFSGIDAWYYSPYDMGVGHNITGSSAGTCGSCSVPAGYATFSPGNNGTFSVFRFTAPTDGSYDIDLTFLGSDFVGPTSSDVHVLHNTTSLFSSFINGFGPSSSVSFATSEFLAAGDTLDIALGWGNNSNYGYDSTALIGTITAAGASAAPEPATTWLIGGAGLILAAYTKRKRVRG